jgi:hypothetical protein
MNNKIDREKIREGYISVIEGISYNLTKETLDKIDVIDVCLIGSGSLAEQGVNVHPNDLDFHVKFNFQDEKLSKILENTLASHSQMGSLTESDVDYFSKSPPEIKLAVNEIVKFFSKTQESINNTIMSVKPIGNYVDITADKMMFNSTSFSMNVGRVGDIEYTQETGKNMKFNSCLMSLEKSFIRKLTSSRDKDSASLSILAKNIDVDILIATVRQMQSYNTTDLMSELGQNLLSTAHESTNSLEECLILHKRYQDLISDITQAYVHESDVDCFSGLSINEENILALNKKNSETYYTEDLDLSF